MLRDGARADVEGTRDGRVGTAERSEAQDMNLPVGQAVENARSGRAEALAGTVSLAGPLDGVDQRATQDAEQRSVVFAEVAAGPVERDADDLAARARDTEGNLVLDRDVPEHLGVKPEAVETLMAEKITDLDGLVIAGSPVVHDKRVLVRENGEGRQAVRCHHVARVRDDVHLTRLRADLVVTQAVAANQAAQPRQSEFREPRGFVEFAEAVDQPHGLLKSAQRYVHGCPPRSLARPHLASNMPINDARLRGERQGTARAGA
jgi:hypothetical protein